MREKELVTWLGSMCMVLLLAGFSSTGYCADPAPKAIKIGAVVSVTGAYAAGGRDLKAGYELSVKHINADGGVYVKEFGKKLPLELILLDDESDTTKTVSRMEKLYSVDKVLTYLGGFGSGMNVAQLATAEKNKVPWVAVTLAVDAPLKQGYKYTFRAWDNGAMDTESMIGVIESIPKDKRPTKLAYWELKDDWGIETGAAVRALCPKHGIEIVSYEKYSPSTTDFSSLILAARKAGAEIVCTTYIPPQSLTVPKQMKELGWRPKLHFSQRGPDLGGYWDALREDANYILSCGTWDEAYKYPGNKRMVGDYYAANPRAKFIGLPVGAGYFAVQIVADAVKRAGAFDREKIRQALAATDFVTIRGPIKFDKENKAILKEGWRQWQNGKQVLVYPLEHAAGPVLLAPPW
ncbi:MAG: amino acid ABC transporter substrate-binding protein [Deltaproteobacteria bacterium]|nr:amino acid ABC transporter substrate-binding protein [Deltaproteobacteria bacterium]